MREYLCEGGAYCEHGSDSTHWVESELEVCPNCGSPRGGPGTSCYGCGEPVGEEDGDGPFDCPWCHTPGWHVGTTCGTCGCAV